MLRATVRFLVVALLLFLAVFPLAALFGVYRWNSATEGYSVRMRELPSPPSAFPPAVADEEMAALPPPVARYLRAVIPPGARAVTEARFRWRGEFLVRPGPKGWRSLEGEQVSRVAPAGFVWSASMALVPAVGVFARDSFVGGEGATRAAVLGLYPLVDAGGTPEAASASLQRHLAEAVWFPTALLPRCGVRWDPIDDGSARATLASGGTTVSLDFRFGPDGLVESVYAPARFRLVDGRAVATPWEARVREYVAADVFRVPSSGEAAWLLPEGRFPYWRGTVKEMAYEREEGAPAPAGMPPGR